MTRLSHPSEAFDKRMRISRNRIFIFVEGPIRDPYFYSKLFNPICEQSSLRCEILHTRELPPEYNGKKGLIDLYDVLMGSGNLITNYDGISKIAIFCLDKDVDDIIGSLRHSVNILYTEYYDVQNYIFRHGNLQHASEIVTSVPEGTFGNMRDNISWCNKVARKWREWIAICLFIKENSVNGEANYRKTSCVNDKTWGLLDTNEYTLTLERVKQKSGLSDGEFESKYTEVLSQVDEYIDNYNHDKVFKGKWYAGMLAYEIRCQLFGKSFDKDALDSRLVDSLVGTLNFNDDWTDHFRAPFKALLQLLV